MTDVYGLFGYPVEHSWSPFIHGMFARQTGQDMTYQLHESAPERFRDDLLDFFRDGGSGTNITLPHKQAAADIVDELTPRAQRADAVNTILYRDNGLLGDNTDGAGLVSDLTSNLGLDLAGARFLLLGAGGGARGILGPLLELGPELLVIANRTLKRAQTLVREFAEDGPVRACRFGEIGPGSFDLIVNATSTSLRGDVPPIPTSAVNENSVCYDLSYGVGDTSFSQWGKEQGARTSVQGWGMLVEQAAGSFQLWRGVKPDTAPVLEALRQRAAGPSPNG
jgi:shikimate dehydrogenase